MSRLPPRRAAEARQPPDSGFAKRVSHGDLTDAQDRSHRQDRRTAYPDLIDKGAVRGVEIGDEQFVVGDTDYAMFARNALVRKDDIGGLRPSDLHS